jgi:hypothetical protein
MPPKTADAADALRSVRREKLIGFSLEDYCSCNDPMSRVISVLARLLQRPHAAATQALADQDCFGQTNACTAARLAWFARRLS